MVYKLARLGSTEESKSTLRDPAIFATLRTFGARLEKIRKRHDELDPLEDDWSDSEDDEFRPRAANRSTIASTWGVHEKPWVMESSRSRKASSEAPNLEDTPEDQDEEGDREARRRVEGLEGAEDARDTTVEAIDERNASRLSPGFAAGRSDLSNDPNDFRLPPIPQKVGETMRSVLGNATANSSTSSLGSTGKTNKLNAAKKVAGGWWNTLKNMKTSGNSNGKTSEGSADGKSGKGNKKKEGLDRQDTRSVNEDLLHSPLSSSPATTVQASDDTRPNPARAPSPPVVDDTQNMRRHQEQHSPSPPLQDLPKIAESESPLEAKAPTGLPQHLGPASSTTSPEVEKATLKPPSTAMPSSSDILLKIEVTSPRLRKSSSRKSIRRKSGAASASPRTRSRRSSVYSFDLDVDTPRSDAFDFPLSPNSLTSPLSPGGALSISPMAFNSLMDGTAFGMAEAGSEGTSSGGVPASPSRPTHRRGKSNSSVHAKNSSTRGSRPASTYSDKERGGPSPRVSKRFSKRASILPPPALDLLRESPNEPVPKIPEQYKTPTSGNSAAMPSAGFGTFVAPSAAAQPRAPSPEPYELRMHPYAIRGLREYEDCLDEWELFVVRAKEEEGLDGKEVRRVSPCSEPLFLWSRWLTFAHVPCHLPLCGFSSSRFLVSK